MVASEFFPSGTLSNVPEPLALLPTRSEKQLKKFVLMAVFFPFSPEKAIYKAANFLIWLFLARVLLTKDHFTPQHEDDSTLSKERKDGASSCRATVWGGEQRGEKQPQDKFN